MTKLSEYVERDALDEALLHVRGFTPQRVREELFAEEGWTQDGRPYGRFLERWYNSLSSPYLRAEAADCFCQAFLTEVADADDAEYIGAAMSVNSKRDVLLAVIRRIRSEDVSDWNTAPEEPLTDGELEAWLAVAEQMEAISLPTAKPFHPAGDGG